MAKFQFTYAADVSCYGRGEIEADTFEQAIEKLTNPDQETRDMLSAIDFDAPEWDSQWNERALNFQMVNEAGAPIEHDNMDVEYDFGVSLDPYGLGPQIDKVRALKASLTELSDWMRDNTGPSDGTLDMLTRAMASLGK